MNIARLWLIGLLVLVGFSLPEQEALGWEAHRADSHAPIGVLGDHMHHAGEWMLSYRAFFLHPSEALSVEQQIGIMYAPHDELTLMAMFPFRRLRPDFPSLMALYAPYRQERHRWHLNLGLLAPLALQVGLTYFNQGDQNSWGLQGISRFSFDLKLPSLVLTAWVAGLASKGLSGSLRLIAQVGPKGLGATLGLGLNFYRLQAPLQGHRLAVEAIFPVYNERSEARVLQQVILGWQYVP